METSVMGSNAPSNGFWYPLVVETTYSFKDLLGAMGTLYGWCQGDSVTLKYWEMLDEHYVPLQNDEHVGCMFAQNLSAGFGRIEVRVLQKPRLLRKEKGKAAAVEQSKSANSELPPTPRRSNPSKPTGSASQTTAGSVDEDVLPDEAVPRFDDEDETMFPEHVDQPSKLAVVQFVGTDSEEEEENHDMLIDDEYDGEDMPEIEWNRDNPNLSKGAIYKNMHELRNALTMYCIQTNNIYDTEKNESKKLTVHCPSPRCSWKLHATRMRGKKTVQVIG